ncbi:MAG TPA: HEAT repeat domain-containing protein [bacterium]|uniref:PBS lyase HEAT-like repeat protein n=1 Tax=candidate division TA06 bacterium ADurb.Bin417 TaxID=1852828 RepID=A0A1V5MAJ6_UNCT6|nr:MAG: PBS lyase HEAT-like repeat protein [candidate division TA06 bacterium ADurb.Bin417]HNQ34862.1 HEAT repeat domain-containing protein [bacterium]HNS48264.1 HEAT repeat domain-containing protein [bacterium]
MKFNLGLKKGAGKPAEPKQAELPVPAAEKKAAPPARPPRREKPARPEKKPKPVVDKEVQHLLKAFTGGKSWTDVETAAGKLLGKGGAAVEPLCEILKGAEKDVLMARNTAYLLGWIGDERAVEPLTHLLKNYNPHIRQAAAESLGMMGSRAAMPALLDMLKENEPTLRLAAADALGRIDDPSVKDILAGLLKDDNLDLRWAAARGLARRAAAGRITVKLPENEFGLEKEAETAPPTAVEAAPPEPQQAEETPPAEETKSDDNPFQNY